jgi:hypothetical protein
VRDRLQPVCQEVGAGEHRKHAVDGARFVGRDRTDVRMRVWRSHHRRVRLARQVEVVAEAAAAGEEAQVLLPPDVAADPDAHAKTSVAGSVTVRAQ